ncbi:MAG: 1-acyl-sn-glycerol-3-phosphate acyltransferase, partial [Hydrogenophaga sp.]
MYLLNLLRSILHTLFMAVTVIPWGLAVLIAAPFLNSTQIYWMCAGWLKLAVNGGTVILGIKNHVIGFENLPVGSTAPAVLLVKHQSTWETFSMPALMPHPLAY